MRRYDREYLLWQSTVAIRSDPVGSRFYCWQHAFMDDFDDARVEMTQNEAFEDIGRAIAINAVGHRECCAHDIERAVPEWLVGAHGR